MLNPGDIINGRYRILEQLGAGAMGIVFSAVHIDTEKRVALKWLNPAVSSVPSSAERFKREAKATGRINHPNVVAVHDSGEHDGQLYLAMEFLAGRTLRTHLTEVRAGRLSLDEALGLFFPIMRGIAAAHAAGVLHRDLKPENVLLVESPDGLAAIPKVLDFGLAKLRSEAEFAAKLSMPGSVLGTYQYMAPEQIRSQGEVDERADVYALGAMLYEMLSGGPPYRADNPIDLVLQLHASEAPLLDVASASLPDDLAPVVAKALARDRDERFSSVESFAAALEPFTQQLRFRGGAQLMAAAVEAANSPKKTKALSATQRIEMRLLSSVHSVEVSARREVRSSRRWALSAFVFMAAAFLLHPRSMELRTDTAAAENVKPEAQESGEHDARPDPTLPPEVSAAVPATDTREDWAAAPEPSTQAPVQEPRVPAPSSPPSTAAAIPASKDSIEPRIEKAKLPVRLRALRTSKLSAGPMNKNEF